jgi:hypothetical protein
MPLCVSIGATMVGIEQIIPFQMTDNAEAEACDLLMEVEEL